MARLGAVKHTKDVTPNFAIDMQTAHFVRISALFSSYIIQRGLQLHNTERMFPQSLAVDKNIVRTNKLYASFVYNYINTKYESKKDGCVCSRAYDKNSFLS